MCGAHKILSAYTVGKISNAPSANIKGTTADIVEEKKKNTYAIWLVVQWYDGPVGRYSPVSNSGARTFSWNFQDLSALCVKW
jgi:hypothetical protein